MKRFKITFSHLVNAMLAVMLTISFPVFSQIKISKAEGIKLSQYKTFAVQQGQVVSGNRITKKNEREIFEMIKEKVTVQMTLRGYKLVPDSTAQLVVSYLYDVSEKLDPKKAGPLGQTPVEDPTAIDASYYHRENESRVLILDMEKNNSSVWTANCSMNGIAKNMDKLFELTIESAFRKFPIQGKGK